MSPQENHWNPLSTSSQNWKEIIYSSLRILIVRNTNIVRNTKSDFQDFSIRSERKSNLSARKTDVEHQKDLSRDKHKKQNKLLNNQSLAQVSMMFSFQRYNKHLAKLAVDGITQLVKQPRICKGFQLFIPFIKTVRGGRLTNLLSSDANA